MKNYRKLANRLMDERQSLKTALKEERKAIEELSQQLKDEQEAQRIIQAVTAGIQQKVHSRIAEIVTRCLQTVFDNPYTFEIQFEQKRGKTEARLVYKRDGKEFDPTFSAGGGVLDVTAFALRLAALMLTKPQPRKLLVLDEPFRFCSRIIAPKIRELLMSLAKEMDVQFVLVTHDPLLIAGKVFDFS